MLSGSYIESVFTIESSSKFRTKSRSCSVIVYIYITVTELLLHTFCNICYILDARHNDILCKNHIKSIKNIKLEKLYLYT